MTHAAIWGAATVIVKIPAAVADGVHQPRNLGDQPSLFDPDPALKISLQRTHKYPSVGLYPDSCPTTYNALGSRRRERPRNPPG